MCVACDWAPHFQAFGGHAVNRRAVLRSGAAMTATAMTATGMTATGMTATGMTATALALDRVPTGARAGQGSGRAAAAEPADVVFHNGPVYTVAGPAPWAEAVAVRGNTIVHVGDAAGAMALAGPATQVVDLEGRLLMPGFVEGHTHPFLGAFLTSGVDLQLDDLAQVLAAIEAHARAHPTGPIRGFGWRVDMFPPEGPNRAELDAILPDRPAFFFAIDGHSLWANSRALAMAGVDRDTPDPIPRFSYYARDQKGDPTGYVLEVNAVLELVNAVEPISVAAMGSLLEGWLPKAAAAGITTVFDAGVPPVGSDQAAIIALYAEAEKRGTLPFRVSASYSVKSLPIDDTVEQFNAVRRQVSSEFVHVDIVKIVGDGSQGGYTAWLIEPYADLPDSTGGSPFTEAQWHDLVGAVDAAGFDVHVHACGERTARVALDAIEKAVANNPARDRRHAIAHLVYVEDSDAPRFARLGVTAQFSANWSSADPDTLQNMMARYGAHRASRMYRTRTILRQGGRVSFGTDWPAAGYVSTYEPLKSIQVGVTRQLVGRPDAPVLSPAEERLTVAEAIHANTMGAAYQLRMDDRIGSVEVGKRADLIVLDRNILAIDPHEIHRTAVVLTMMDGVVRHRA